jgi:hypothetical protein
MDLREMGWDGMNWMHLAQDTEGPVPGSCKYSNGPLGSINRWGI